MLRKLFLFSLSVVFMISLGGCATARKQEEMDLQQLKNQVTLLESQLQAKDEETNMLSKAEVGKEAKATAGAWMRPKVKDIQNALSNAGYSPGPIDGRMGKQTREAIKAFQLANNLNPDGRVGEKTWNLLREYLEKKVK